MQLNRQIIIILILASLLFSAVGAAFYFYNKNKKVMKSKNQLVTIFIAKDDIKRNTLLTVSHLAKTKVAKQFILNKPLLKSEILGKYTKERIYKNEVFLKQKLNTKIEKSRAKVLDYKNSSYNMKFNMFKNPNYSLVQGDVINIISVYPKAGTQDKKGKYLDYETQYVSKNIKILGFIRNGFTESETITKQKVKKVIKKKITEEVLDVKSDEVILDIEPQVLITLLSDFNKGNQLWMVKTKESIQIEPVDKMPIKEAIKIVENKVITAKKVYKPKVYKYKWYVPKTTIVRKSAIIDYTNDEKDSDSKTKSVEIVVNPKKICSGIKNKLLIGTASRFYLRVEGSTKSAYKRIVERNTIIPYIEKLNHWYKTCDGLYVSKNVVKETSYKYAIKKVGR
ncbi:hypothetical protein [Poseidonibacter lekithochrous]|uniref:hypothetical protein n=1 Tax=Poseidonibacter lekithochrous TaxID=1904463 RepID=UPI000D351675|nr:hypothetical protein [Poseidonibacter lekithochrous]